MGVYLCYVDSLSSLSLIHYFLLNFDLIDKVAGREQWSSAAGNNVGDANDDGI